MDKYIPLGKYLQEFEDIPRPIYSVDQPKKVHIKTIDKVNYAYLEDKLIFSYPLEIQYGVILYENIFYLRDDLMVLLSKDNAFRYFKIWNGVELKCMHGEILYMSEIGILHMEEDDFFPLHNLSEYISFHDGEKDKCLYRDYYLTCDGGLYEPIWNHELSRIIKDLKVLIDPNYQLVKSEDTEKVTIHFTTHSRQFEKRELIILDSEMLNNLMDNGGDIYLPIADLEYSVECLDYLAAKYLNHFIMDKMIKNLTFISDPHTSNLLEPIRDKYS